MRKVIIPFILVGKQGGVLLPGGNKEANPELFSTVGWDPLEPMPNNKLRNVGYCRCGKGMMIFYWPEVSAIKLVARTILRCHDQHGEGCKLSIALPGLIQTYGELLFALQDENSAVQAALIEELRRDWLVSIAERENGLRTRHEAVLAAMSYS